jgi:L-cysteine/cystine lyase
MTFEEARAQFPVLERYAYLNTGTLGPLSRATLAAMEERSRFDQEQGRGGKIWFESVIALRERARERLAALVDAPPDRLALTSSTTDGCNIVASGLRLGPEDEVVTTDSEHPGLLLPLKVSGVGVRVAEVAGRSTENALETILSSITRRTKLIALSHVLWTTGQLMPVHELKREAGVPVLVDGAQAAGAIPVSVGDLDYYTVSCQKWLCGPEPLGALYVREPEELSIAIPSSFAQTAIEKDGAFIPRAGAARFDSGWLATAALAGLVAALAGAPAWRFERSAEMASVCRQALAERFEVVGGDEQGTLISFTPPGEPNADALRLYERGVIVRDLPGTGWLRASIAWWTSHEDIARLTEGLGA